VLVYIHTHVHVYIHTHTQTHTHITVTCVCACIYSHTCACIYSHTHTNTFICCSCNINSDHPMKGTEVTWFPGEPRKATAFAYMNFPLHCLCIHDFSLWRLTASACMVFTLRAHTHCFTLHTHCVCVHDDVSLFYKLNISKNLHIQPFVYIYVYIYIYVCVCVSVCMYVFIYVQETALYSMAFRSKAFRYRHLDTDIQIQTFRYRHSDTDI
jgi:hypothetical protein